MSLYDKTHYNIVKPPTNKNKWKKEKKMIVHSSSNFTTVKSTQVYAKHIFTVILFISHTVRQVGSKFPNQGLNTYPLHWKHGVLTTGLPGKSPFFSFFKLVTNFSSYPFESPSEQAQITQ